MQDAAYAAWQRESNENSNTYCNSSSKLEIVNLNSRFFYPKLYTKLKLIVNYL